MIDPARILNVQEDVKTRRQSGEDESDYVYYSGIKVQVKDDPRIEVINKRTNAPVNDIELHNEWREDPLAYNLLNKPMEVETNPYRGFNKINTNYGVRGAADLSFQMVPDAQGNQVPLILPIYRSTSTDLTPLIIAGTLLAGGLYFGPGATAGAAGTGRLQVLLRERQRVLVLLRVQVLLLWERQVYLLFTRLRLRLSESLR
jgi:hypothetical protein